MGTNGKQWNQGNLDMNPFIERKAKDLRLGDTPQLAPNAMDTLMTYAWPGNVRELENIVERAMILHRGEALSFEGLEATASAHPAPKEPGSEGDSFELDSIVAAHIRQVLDKTGGKIHGPGGAGELLGVNPSTLRGKMKKLGIATK